MDAYLKQQLRQVVTVATPTGALDAAGQAVVGSTATFPCRYECSFREVPIYGGVEERTMHFLVLDETFNLTPVQARNALFWLPGFDATDASLARRAKVVEYLPDENGVIDHVEVTL